MDRSDANSRGRLRERFGAMRMATISPSGTQRARSRSTCRLSSKSVSAPDRHHSRTNASRSMTAGRSCIDSSTPSVTGPLMSCSTRWTLSPASSPLRSAARAASSLGHRENPHPSRRPQHRLQRLPPRTAAPCVGTATPGLPINDAVLTAPARAPQPRCASPPAPLGIHRHPDIRSPLPAPNRVTSTAICLFPHQHRTRQRPHRYSHNYVNRRVVLPILP